MLVNLEAPESLMKSSPVRMGLSTALRRAPSRLTVVGLVRLKPNSWRRPPPNVEEELELKLEVAVTLGGLAKSLSVVLELELEVLSRRAVRGLRVNWMKGVFPLLLIVPPLPSVMIGPPMETALSVATKSGPPLLTVPPKTSRKAQPQEILNESKVETVVEVPVLVAGVGVKLNSSTIEVEVD